MKIVYMDNNATTQVAPSVIEAMAPYLHELYGNPSSAHYFGGEAQKGVNEAREKVAALLGAEPEEIIFTSCGTESDNTALWAAVESFSAKRHIITTRVEHPAVLGMATYLEKKGYKVTYLGVDHDGNLDLDEVEAAITDETALVSIMWANNETGIIFDVEQIAQRAWSKGVIFHTDAVQAVGKIPINVKSNIVHSLSLSGHKLHAPKGVGVLYVRKGTPFVPFLRGGHQERGRRGGTENVPSIIALGKACELAGRHMEEENTRVKAMRDRLEQGIFEKIPNVILNGNKQNRLPNTLSISFEYVEGESILLLLSNLGVCASSGSACTSGSLEPSHVLRAMGVPFTAAHGSIRFSLSIYNTSDEVDYVLEHLPGIIARLRDISPFWKDYAKRASM